MIFRQQEELKQIRFKTEQIQIETISTCHIIDDRVILFKKPPEVERAEIARELGSFLLSNDLVKIETDPEGTEELQKKYFSVEVVRRKAND